MAAALLDRLILEFVRRDATPGGPFLGAAVTAALRSFPYDMDIDSEDSQRLAMVSVAIGRGGS